MDINFVSRSPVCRTLAALVIVPTTTCDLLPMYIVHQLKPYQTFVREKYLIIAAGSLPLAHNAQHSTSYSYTR